MAVIVKSSIKLSKGFDTWQAMVKSQENRIKEMGIKFLFAGTESGLMTPISEEYFTNYPDAHMKH